MKQILIAAVVLALLAIQGNTCLDKKRNILPVRPPKIPIDCPYLPIPRQPYQPHRPYQPYRPAIIFPDARDVNNIQ